MKCPDGLSTLLLMKSRRRSVEASGNERGIFLVSDPSLVARNRGGSLRVVMHYLENKFECRAAADKPSWLLRTGGTRAGCPGNLTLEAC